MENDTIQATLQVSTARTEAGAGAAKHKVMHLARVAALSGMLTVGALGVTSASAQEATVPAAVSDVTEEADDGGFDDWGLLGLLGLGGLAGLLKRPTHEVRTVDRVNRVDDPIR
jgi:MYXO-CTERM domain-containing protein